GRPREGGGAVLAEGVRAGDEDDRRQRHVARRVDAPLVRRRGTLVADRVHRLDVKLVRAVEKRWEVERRGADRVCLEVTAALEGRTRLGVRELEGRARLVGRGGRTSDEGRRRRRGQVDP